MTKMDLKEKVLKLSPKERRELAAELWESGVDHPSADIPAWHRAVIEERLEKHRNDPKNVISEKEALARLGKPRA